MKKIKGYISISLLLIFSACITYTLTINTKNLAYLYDPTGAMLHPFFLVKNTSDSSTKLYIKFYPVELLYNQAPATKIYQAKMKIHYSLYPSFADNQLIDSASVIYYIDQKYLHREMNFEIPLKIPQNNKYLLAITTTDLLRKASTISYVPIDMTSVYNRQNYIVRDTKTLYLLFHNYLKKSENIFIACSARTSKIMYVSYYKTKFPLPAPPFSSVSVDEHLQTADTVWSYNNYDSLKFSLTYHGIYHFQIDTTVSDGLTLMNFTEHFPQHKTAEEMIEPLQYLTTSKEYDEMAKSKTKKETLDKFWLTAGGDVYKSKELIRVFYNRIVYANLYFTSYTEGWRTDRGMIYTIFGPPQTINKDNNYEKWIYGDNRSYKSVTFKFNKVDSRFSDNHFILERNLTYKNSWYQAVDSWRSGHIYVYQN